MKFSKNKVVIRNKVLFLTTFLLGMVLTAARNGYYVAFLHEMNHILAGLITGHLPFQVSINDGHGYVVLAGVLQKIRFIDHFISVSGAGLAFASPGIILYLGYKVKLAGICGFWIPGSILVIQDWGVGTDFKEIQHLELWAMFMALFTILLYILLILLISWEIGKKLGTTEDSMNINL